MNTTENKMLVSDGIDTWEVNGNKAIQENLKQVLAGRFFKVTFNKADGSERVMNCRMGVHKFVKGTGQPKPDNIVTVYVPSLEQYRSFTLDRLKSISCGAIEIVAEAA